MNGNLKGLIDHPAESGPRLRRRYAAAAGALCAGASLCTLGSSILLEGDTAMTAIALAAFGLLLALLCFVVPWERVGPSAVHLAPGAATLAVAVATTTIDATYGFYFVLVAGFVAYSFSSRSVIGLHLGLIALALVAPIVVEPEGTRKALACALIFGPGVILVATIGIYLRRSGEARDRAYREFANDALALTSRIRSRVGAGASPAAAQPWLEAPAPTIPMRSVGVARVVRAPAAAAPVSIGPRLRLAAGGVAAVLLVALGTTAAIVGGDARPAPTAGSPALVRDAQPRLAEDEPRPRAGRLTHRRPERRAERSRESAAPVTVAPPAAASATAADQGAAAPGPSPRPPVADREAPLAARPPAGPAPSAELTPPPAPVQQVAPDPPVESAVGLVDQAVGPLADQLDR